MAGHHAPADPKACGGSKVRVFGLLTECQTGAQRGQMKADLSTEPQEAHSPCGPDTPWPPTCAKTPPQGQTFCQETNPHTFPGPAPSGRFATPTKGRGGGFPKVTLFGQHLGHRLPQSSFTSPCLLRLYLVPRRGQRPSHHV